MDAAGGGGAVAVGGPDDADAVFFSRRGHRCCGCFWAPAPWASSSPHARRRASAGADDDEEWWHGVGEGAGSGAGAAPGRRRQWWRRGVDALMKVREWSELVAGPRWKTFIRRFRFSRRSGPRHGAANNGGAAKLNYDPLSYALNFDEGHGGGSPEGGDYQGYRDFSARFVALVPPPPGSARSSMDLGGRDAPPPLFLHRPHSPRPPATTAAARG